MDCERPSDAELMRRFQKDGDRKALAVFFERHRALAYRVAISVLGDADDAEDAAQDAFLHLIAYAPRVRAEQSLAGLVACLSLRSARQLARSAGRRQLRERTVACLENGIVPGVLDEVSERETRRIVRDAVDTLAERYRLPVVLHYFEGLSTRETAEALGITQTAVTTRLSRAVGKLRDHLKRSGLALEVPALVALFAPQRADAAPATLAAHLDAIAVGARPLAAPATGLGALAGTSAAAKLCAGLLVASAIGGGIAVMQRMPPPTRAEAGTTVSDAPATTSGADTGNHDGSESSPVPVPTGTRSVTAPQRAAAQDARPPRKRPMRGRHTARAPQAVGKVQPAPHRAEERSRLPEPQRQQSAQADGPQPIAATPLDSASPTSRKREQMHPRMTREEMLRLAGEIALTAWHESTDTGYSGRRYFVRVLAASDPAVAERLVEEAPPDERVRTRLSMLEGMLQELPPADAERALARLLTETAPERTLPLLRAGQKEIAASTLVAVLTRNARVHAALHPAAARGLLDRALVAIRWWPLRPSALGDLGTIAATAKEIGDARIVELVSEVQRFWPAHLAQTLREAPDAGRAVLWSASKWAAVDPDQAFRMLETAPTGTWRDVIGPMTLAAGIAGVDPARAFAVFQAHRPEAGKGEPDAWGYYVRRAIIPLARHDTPAAESLACAIPNPADRAEALAALSTIVPVDRAEPLHRTALEAALQTPGNGAAHAAARVAELMPVGPDRRNVCNAALQSLPEREGARAPDPGSLAHIAYALAPVDAKAAKAVLEDALRIAEESGDAEFQTVVVLAFTPVDPARAVALARRIPAGRSLEPLEALRKIAAYLAAPDDVRATVPFWRWATLPQWNPGADWGAWLDPGRPVNEYSRFP